MRPNKPQSKSQQDTTIDSEVEELLKIPLVGGDIQDLADGINRLIAQEANKAVLAELQKVYDDRGIVKIKPGGHFGWDNKGNKESQVEIIPPQAIKNRIAQLTGDKEQADG